LIVLIGALVRLMMADSTARRSADRAVMPSQMTGYATYDRTFYAAFGIGCACQTGEN
jgi:hypothetical protein